MYKSAFSVVTTIKGACIVCGKKATLCTDLLADLGCAKKEVVGVWLRTGACVLCDSTDSLDSPKSNQILTPSPCGARDLG